MTTAAVYLRVSGERQDEANQEPDCLRLCAARGWETLVFRERMSGVKRRPEWERLKEAARTGGVGAVVFWALDRTGRTPVQIAHDVGELWRWNMEVTSVKDAWIDQPAGPLRDLLLHLMAWVAGTERRKLIERTVAGIARVRAAGKTWGRRRTVPEMARARAIHLHRELPHMTAGMVKRALAAEGLGVFHVDTVRSIMEKGR